MKGTIRTIIITAVMTCSITVNIGMYHVYAKPTIDATESLTSTLAQLPVTKKGKG